jgi:hypothetical protein
LTTVSTLRWEDDIKIDLEEVGCMVMDWIDVALGIDHCWIFVNNAMNFGDH